MARRPAAATTAMPAAAPISNQVALDSLLALREALERAFDGAMEVSDMRRIARAMHATTDEILRLNALGIAALGKAYAPDLEALSTAIDDLKHIRDNIRKISSSIKTIAEVINAITKVAAFLPL